MDLMELVDQITLKVPIILVDRITLVDKTTLVAMATMVAQITPVDRVTLVNKTTQVVQADLELAEMVVTMDKLHLNQQLMSLLTS